MSVITLMLYSATWLLVALTPGPAVMCVVSQAARYGWRAACLGVLGIQLGNIALFICIACGLVALLATATNALMILQFAGAGYLIYFGARIISSSFRAPWRDQLQAAGLPSFRRRLVLQALVIQVTNPKALLFVSALLPQFLGANEHIPLQLAALLICTVLVDAFVLGSYAFLVGRGVQSIRSRQLSRWIERAFGVALVSIGIKLLVWRR
jgi:homoserine/homoserine lactone efflux protein